MANNHNFTIPPSILTSQIPSHNHGILNPGHNHGIIYGGAGGAGGGGGGAMYTGGMGAGGLGYASMTVTGNVNITNGLRFDNVPSLRVQINGMPAPEGERFASSRDLFTTDLRLDDQRPNHFHYRVWIENYGEEYSDYGMVFRSGSGCYAAFGSAVSRDHFEDWYADYRAKFFQDVDPSTSTIPDPEPGRLNGYYVSDPPPERDVNGNFSFTFTDPTHEKQWAWIVAHCNHAVVRMPKGWLFANDTDAVVFKMK
jgi:hypothetical protein